MKPFFRPISINLLLSIILLASCGSQSSQPEPSTTVESVPAEIESVESNPQELQDIWISIDAVPGEGSALINGKTNLPDGFVLSVSACRYHQGPEEPRCQMANEGKAFQGLDQEVIVQNGEFSVELSPIRSVDEVKALLEESWAREQEIAEMTGIPVDESGLSYTSDFLVDSQVTISTRGFVRDQPPEVIEIIGEEGENLNGLIVEDGVTGQSISYSAKLDI
ncbi:MAG: hypothetical protein AAF810_04885 [Cyanobacteria bacterium P01_D01_bin.36]